MSCGNCRGRFDLPPDSSGRCEICATLARLNRVILTRHPAEEAGTLLKLLNKTAAKVESFVEEWELNRALGASIHGDQALSSAGGSAPDPPGPSLPGLTPVSKKSTAPKKKKEHQEADAREAETGKEASSASGLHPVKEEPRRSRSRKRKRDESRKRRDRTRSEAEARDRRRRSRQEKELEEVIKTEEPEEVNKRATPPPIEGSEESPIREDRKSPDKREDAGDKDVSREKSRAPRSPSRSPPGFNRTRDREWEDRPPIIRDKPRKDKGYNHYLRGKEFRDKHGFDRGRGRGAWSW